MEFNKFNEKIIKQLEKLNIKNSIDLITYYPFRYELVKRSIINELNDGDNIIIDGYCEKLPVVYYINKKMNKMSFKINIGGNILGVAIYNRGFLKSKIKIGTPITVYGKYDLKHQFVTANNMELSLLGNETRIVPIYHSTYGITSKQINILIRKTNIEVKNIIPEYLYKKYNLLPKGESIIEVHNPSSIVKLNKARAALKYEELFLFMLKINYLKMNKNMIGLSRNVKRKDIDEFVMSLPFNLTMDQTKAVNDIYKDLISGKRMNRLLQGDVGSGKTIVSFIAIYINYLAGYQSALMAPTEILAVQHFNNILKIFKNYGINVGLLTGKMKTSEKKKICADLLENKIDVLIGTHALFTNNVMYNNLGLVITDEQHRFGVRERTNFKNKGILPDVLYMSATPIPRTYALTLYGDMDVSNIKTMPSGRKDVITILKNESEMREVLQRIHNEIKLNHQVYVIAPSIEESEKINMENVYDLEEKFNQAFGKICKIGILHGKMSGKEKDEIMNRFKDNKIAILISTTVIEVGVDVKNATMMVIFDSYRFGLSTLHQLRGRVGRNDLQSYCILISNVERERLNVLTNTNDGFKISEEDFILRGGGDIFGVRQSGDMVFKIADIRRDYKILLKAKEDSEEYLKSNHYLGNKAIENFLIEETDLG
ncbi:MAG: ATP-dependent DNA helicase RecG [Bacilli bacterium]|nr:ATP-dependent DNA helicase RecG [Bacilli bacterium]